MQWIIEVIAAAFNLYPINVYNNIEQGIFSDAGFTKDRIKYNHKPFGENIIWTYNHNNDIAFTHGFWTLEHAERNSRAGYYLLTFKIHSYKSGPEIANITIIQLYNNEPPRVYINS